MSKAVRESINQASREANPEVPANDLRVSHQMCDLIQTSLRDFGIGVDKPKNLPVRDARAGIHLPGPTSLAHNELMAKACRESICSVGAPTVRDDDLRFRRPLAQMPKKWAYQRRLIKNGDDD
jgi:hypothetical protein